MRKVYFNVISLVQQYGELNNESLYSRRSASEEIFLMNEKQSKISASYSLLQSRNDDE